MYFSFFFLSSFFHFSPSFHRLHHPNHVLGLNYLHFSCHLFPPHLPLTLFYFTIHLSFYYPFFLSFLLPSSLMSFVILHTFLTFLAFFFACVSFILLFLFLLTLSLLLFLLSPLLHSISALSSFILISSPSFSFVSLFSSSSLSLSLSL